MYIFCTYGGNAPPVGGGGNPPGEKFFTIGIFRKKASKYAKLMVEPYIYDNLNQMYHFFLFKKKKHFEIRLEGNRLVSFVPL